MLDELRLMVHPIVLGEGVPLFQDLQKELPLALRQARTSPCGVVLPRCERDRGG